MATARSKAPAIGSAGWLLEERHQSNNLVTQELEDFSFTVRNELEWLNEHMADIFSQNGQNTLDVFKTPGKLRGKTPRTARKKLPAETRQPLSDIFSPNSQQRPSPAQQILQKTLQKHHTKAFQIPQDSENIAPAQSPAALKSPGLRLLPSALPKGKGDSKENHRAFESTYPSEDDIPSSRPGTGVSDPPAEWSSRPSTQETLANSQEDDIFSPPRTQETQPTQATQSFPRDILTPDEERRDTGDSFVSAKEVFTSKRVSNENLRSKYEADVMDVDDRLDTTHSDAQDTVVRHELGSEHDGSVMDHDMPEFPQPPTVASPDYSIGAETHEALDTAHHRVHLPEPKNLLASSPHLSAKKPVAVHDATHQDAEDEMDVDDDVRSPSDNSSPVKPLVRKSSLTFASLPAREPLLAKKSMGNRISRTSHVDQNKAQNSNLSRFTGGKSLGGSQAAQATEAHDAMDADEERPELQREESETTKMHNKTSTQRLYERINMLKQQNEGPKRVSQNVMASQSSQTHSFASQAKENAQPAQPVLASQLAYPQLPVAEPQKDQTPEEEEDDDDWISPIRTNVPAYPLRPPFNKSYSVEERSNSVDLPSSTDFFPRPISASNPDLSTVVESTTPAGSPTSKKHMDGPLSASKAKFYSALRAAKEKIIGSSATSAQVKLDALAESPMRSPMRSPVRPKLFPNGSSSDDVFSSPKRDVFSSPKRNVFGSPERNEKAGTSIFSHLRSPSKESLKLSKVTAVPGSPGKEDNRRTRSSSERERQREKDAREKEVKQKQRAEDRLREMREREQTKATAHYQKSKAAAAAKTPSAMPAQPNIRQIATATTKTPASAAPQTQSRPGTIRTNTAPRIPDPDSADEMPPPPPPKSLLPTTGHKLREPKRLVKANSKDALPKGKPQKILVATNSSRYGQAPPPAARNAPIAPPKTASQAPSLNASQGHTSKFAPAASTRAAPAASRPATAAALRSGHAGPAGPARPASAAAKVAPKPGNRPRAQTAAEKSKASAAQPRADLGAARPISRMQTVQDANRINIPPINPAKPPPKRPFQAEQDETLHRPAKRPSQQAKMNPITPAPAHHSQFAKGKIPFAEPSQPASAAQHPVPNGDDIKLPEIMTDSEDEDSENDFEQPSWVNTPNLRELLTSQQLVDPEQIFGPIAPLNMEAVFPNKERHKRFRDRTSSAFWANDQLTDEEKRKEREARERLVREGAWTYNPSPARPGPSR